EWQNPPSELDRMWMIGVPSEIMARADGSFLFKALLLNVAPTDSPPECLLKPFPRIYGKIDLERTAVEGLPRLTHIKGMSGGPLFAVKYFEGGTKYWIV